LQLCEYKHEILLFKNRREKKYPEEIKEKFWWKRCRDEKENEKGQMK
jgi:hypothetical protein